MRWAFVALKGYVGKFLIYKALLPRCDHVFVQSDRMAIDVAAHGIQRQRMTAVPMGVDLESVPHVRSDDYAAPSELRGKRVIGYLGILDRSRRIDFLFEVLSVVRRTVPNACLLLVGDATEAPDRDWLEARARDLHVDDAVVWTGWVPTQVGWAYLRGTDVAVSLFPRGELLDSASPTKVVEYLALGVPVVANDQPDQHRVLTESGAGLTVAMDVHEFAAAIVKILGDAQLGARMRIAGPPYVKRRRSYALIGQQVADAYAKQFAQTSGSLPEGGRGRTVPRDSA
jgi:glycosyltransferase involved in cell wall biosynthesis